MKVVGAAVRFAERVRHAGGLSVREVVGGRRRVARGVRALENPAQNVLLDDARVPAPVRRREDDSGVRAGVELPRERRLRSRMVDLRNREAVVRRALRDVRCRGNLRLGEANAGLAELRPARARVPACVRQFASRVVDPSVIFHFFAIIVQIVFPVHEQHNLPQGNMDDSLISTCSKRQDIQVAKARIHSTSRRY